MAKASRKSSKEGSEGRGKEGVVKLEGEVVELLPNTLFRIKLSNGHVVLGHISGKMRMNFIKIMPGDRVEMEMSPYDLTRGRIIRRL